MYLVSVYPTNRTQETKIKIPFEILPPLNYLVIIHMDILNLHKYSTFFQYQKVMVEKSSERPVFLVYHSVVNFPIFSTYSFKPARVVSSMHKDISRGVAQNNVLFNIFHSYFKIWMSLSLSIMNAPYLGYSEILQTKSISDLKKAI